jgi:hypothetical protein
MILKATTVQIYYCYRMTANLLGVYDYLGSQENAIFKK